MHAYDLNSNGFVEKREVERHLEGKPEGMIQKYLGIISKFRLRTLISALLFYLKYKTICPQLNRIAYSLYYTLVVAYCNF